MASSSSLLLNANFFKPKAPRVSEENVLYFISKHLDSIIAIELFMASYPDVYRRELNDVYLRLKPIHEDFLNKIFSAKLKQAEKILLANPEFVFLLLTLKGSAKNSRGHTIKGTPLQIAAAALDVGYHDGEEGMVEMLIRHMKKLPNGESIIAKQLKERFPDDYEDHSDTIDKINLSELDIVFHSIKQFDGLTINGTHPKFALDIFLAKQSATNSGLNFSNKSLITSLRFYDKHYIKYDAYHPIINWGAKPARLSFTWSNLIGTLQDSFPDNILLALQQGISHITNEQKHLDRDSKLNIQDLGNDFAFNALGQQAPNHYVKYIQRSGIGIWPPAPSGYDKASPMTKCTTKYFKRKKAVLKEILNEFTKEPKKTSSFRF